MEHTALQWERVITGNCLHKGLSVFTKIMITTWGFHSFNKYLLSTRWGQSKAGGAQGSLYSRRVGSRFIKNYNTVQQVGQR